MMKTSFITFLVTFVMAMMSSSRALDPDDAEEMIQVSAMRSKKYRDWHYKDLESECTTNVECIHTGFCDTVKKKCCAPHGYACITSDNCCSRKHICGGKYAKSCVNPPPPQS